MSTARYNDWVRQALKDLPITEGYFMGSAIYSACPSDVDVLLLVNYSDVNDIKPSSFCLARIQKLFVNRFSLPLHITVCYKPEAKAFHEFKNKVFEASTLIALDLKDVK